EEEPQGEVKSYQEVSDWEENLEQEQSQGEESSSQVSDWEEYSDEELSRGGVKSYQEVSDWEENLEQEQSHREESRGQEVSDWEEYSEEELSHGGVKSYQEVSDWEDYSEEEQSQEVKRHEELSDWEDSSEEEQCHGKGSSSPEVTDLEECSMKVQPQRKFSNSQELLSDWEDSIAQELCQDEDSLGQDFSAWEDYTPSWLCRWEDGSDRELALADWEHRSVPSLGVKALLPEEDEWEELSVLELSQGQGPEDRLGILAAEGLPVPVPRQAWAERRAPAPCTQVPLCTSPPQLEALSPAGTEASPAFGEQVPWAGTQSQVPAPRSPCCPPSPSPPQLEAQALSSQLAQPTKRLSRFRRALGALRRLFRSCTAGQPQD
ncbi:uncharacterized protein LOC113960792, partial [Neopelma chrysocephalum]|uniref:uncharacterized protein LOC113960792 n=1 Tax=Neopelma chrysocephalum TaxID=114329 RepID=UPI000FCD4C91